MKPWEWEWHGGWVTDIKIENPRSHAIKYVVCVGTDDNFVPEEQNDLHTRVFNK